MRAEARGGGEGILGWHRREEAEEKLALVTGRLAEVEMLLEKANRELIDSRAVIKKKKGEMERLRRQYNDRENEWGEKLHGELKKKRELLRDEAREREI